MPKKEAFGYFVLSKTYAADSNFVVSTILNSLIRRPFVPRVLRIQLDNAAINKSKVVIGAFALIMDLTDINEVCFNLNL